MQTLVAASERVLNVLTFHCAVQFARNLVDANPLMATSTSTGKYTRTKSEYPAVVRYFAKDISGDQQYIISKATENAIAYIAAKERQSIEKVKLHFEKEAQKLYNSITEKYSLDILEKQVSFTENLVLKPLREHCGG